MIRFSEELRGTREELLQVARQFQLEGLIAKRPDSIYESGRRSGAWVKVKLTQQQEFVIGGYTPPEGSRMYFGSLLVGYYGPSCSRLASTPSSLGEAWARAVIMETPDSKVRVKYGILRSRLLEYAPNYAPKERSRSQRGADPSGGLRREGRAGGRRRPPTIR
jgi:ATP dependent DNA ligase-like protein